MGERELEAAEGGAASPLTASVSPWDAARRAAGARPILVVDDEESIRRFVATALRAAGFEVHVADSGRSAIQTAFGESAGIALLLTDVDMPGMSGIELAARLRAERPAVEACS